MVLMQREGSEGKDGLRHVQYDAGEDLADFGEDMSPWSLGSGWSKVE